MDNPAPLLLISGVFRPVRQFLTASVRHTALTKSGDVNDTPSIGESYIRLCKIDSFYRQSPANQAVFAIVPIGLVGVSNFSKGEPDSDISLFGVEHRATHATA